jgi:predicted adenylyl cyclase CyaB
VREVELKAVLDDWDATRERIERSGGALVFDGTLSDRRFDTAERALASRDMVLRLRSYSDAGGTRAELGWKGPTSYEGGYKVRQELETGVSSPDRTTAILERLGFGVTHAIDRRILQYRLDGAIVRLERYPRMDDLIEVEGAPDAIERAIATLGIPRAAFTTDRLREFVARFRARTGQLSAVSEDEHAGRVRYDPDDA